jgi:aminoglycoside phosphotransferase
MVDESIPIPVPDGLPPELGLSGVGIRCEPAQAGDSGDLVYRVTEPGQATRWLKTSRHLKWMWLATHRDRLEWMLGKLPVPKVLGYALTGDREWLVTTEVSGLAACDPGLAMPRPEKIRLLAHGLRRIHSVDPAGCPFVDTLASRIARAGGCMATGDHGIRARFALIEKLPRPAEDPVFCHGDYCWPNILIHEGKIGGFIDLAFAGVMDRYADFGQACYSMVRNGDGDYIDLFFREYGMPGVDYGKILYYQDLEFALGAAET